MKILVVEDNVSSKILLLKILKKEKYDVVSACNGIEALEVLRSQSFDLILTDWMMPKMDGIELTELIRKEIKPAPSIIFITALNSREARNKALEAGADDYISKPYHIADIKQRIESAVMRHKSDISSDAFGTGREKIRIPDFSGICIAASTGGPSTLIEFFSLLKPLRNSAIFIVLHGPAWMLKTFTERIHSEIDMPVRLGETGMPVRRGEIYLAPGDIHMLINPGTLELELSDSPPENFVKPSADPLFRSAARVFGSKLIGVVLTGMGRDGSIGSGYISAAGGLIIAQDPATAIASSMPQTVIDLRLAKHILQVKEIPSVIESSLLKF